MEKINRQYWILVFAAIAVLVSCRKEIPGSRSGPAQTDAVTFQLSAHYPEAGEAPKSVWEAGDAIFVFFSGAEAPKHLKMSYDGTAWTSAEYDGATRSAGALGLKNGDTGTMRAVFLPFGSDATVSADGTAFTFSKTCYAYYATAALTYTVADNQVSGAFDMTIPEGYVQFFIKDGAASDEACQLGTDAVIPTGIASVAADGTVTETSDKTYKDDMPGYAFGDGYLFSGKLNANYSFGGYYFAKTKVSDSSRADCFVSGKTLSSHSTLKLPANDNVYAVESGRPNGGEWIPVGAGITVELFDAKLTSLGKWYTCNVGQSVPEALGTLYKFDNANALDVTLPTKDQFDKISYFSDSYTWLTVHGQQGMLIKTARGFLFLPAQYGAGGNYWSSTVIDQYRGWDFSFRKDGTHSTNKWIRSSPFTIRPFQN